MEKVPPTDLFGVDDPCPPMYSNVPLHNYNTLALATHHLHNLTWTPWIPTHSNTCLDELCYILVRRNNIKPGPWKRLSYGRNPMNQLKYGVFFSKLCCKNGRVSIFNWCRISSINSMVILDIHVEFQDFMGINVVSRKFRGKVANSRYIRLNSRYYPARLNGI